MCGGRFYFTVFRSLSTNPKVKELLKSVPICQSYTKNKSGTFFMAHGVENCSLYLSQKWHIQWHHILDQHYVY